MKRFHRHALPFIATLLMMATTAAYGQEQASTGELQSIPNILNRMQSNWQLLVDPSISETRAERLAEDLVEMRRRAGIRGHRSLARAVAMYGWHRLQEGDSERALSMFQLATRLDPLSRDIQSGYATAVAARNPAGIIEYLPLYVDAFFGTFATAEGRYQVLADISLLAGVTLVSFALVWGLMMLIRHLRSVHHVMETMLAAPFSSELGGIIAAALLLLPLALAVPLEWYGAGLVALTWAFQESRERIITPLALCFAWFGVLLIALSATLSIGMVDPLVQAGFSAERFGGDNAMVNAMENRLSRSRVITGDGILDNRTEEQNRDLFLYALGQRRLGREQAAGQSLVSVFDMIAVTDSAYAERARLNAANIRLERDLLRQAAAAYESTMADPAAAPYAHYNLWRIAYNLRDLSRADSIWNQLQAEHPEFAKRFNLETGEVLPVLIDAGLTEEEIQELVAAGIARASGQPDSSSAIDVLVKHATQYHRWWLLAALAFMLISLYLVKTQGTAAACSGCGKVFSRHRDLDPRSSRFCQACSAIRGLKTAVDADLRRDQKRKQETYVRMRNAFTFLLTVVMPGSGQVFRGRALSGFLALLPWSMAVGMVYSFSRMPRAESLPFFSHWTPLTILIIVVLLLTAYAIALFDFLMRKGDIYGT